MTKYITFIATVALSFQSAAFGLPKVEVPSISTDAQNMVAALKIIQDGGIECSKITDFKVATNVKGYQVQCDATNNYTILDTDNGLVLQVK
ncbi:hypothetical protein [Aliivibrio kagoshimensis]|uniref:hypothetical protein n=1 Tax=Aliivibrio kagoshimensis TaxID=2910230 RepID=UPI003D0E8AA3